MKNLNEFLKEKELDHILFEAINFDSMTKDDAISALKHLREQFKIRYKYLVGEWEGARRAKNTRDGKFVKADEVIAYLENKKKNPIS